MDMREDAVADLGYLALGTRLKRLAEQLQAGVAEVLVERGEAVQPGQLPLLVAVAGSDGLTIAQLVKAIGVSQPAISRMLGSLERDNLVRFETDPDDARVRRVSLTPRSRRLLDGLRTTIFPSVAAAAAELCVGLDLLTRLSTIEARNRELSFADRIRKAVA
jgi:DNA-binding MarR family transcriptional regulator